MVKLLHSKLDRFSKLKKLVSETSEVTTSGYIYIGHLPPGFEERSLKKFFTQFGPVLRAKLSRSKTTGGSRGFGFIEFQNKEDAKIAAETMQGMLLFGKKIVCEYKDKVNKFAMIPCKKNVADKYPDFKERYNASKTTRQMQQRVLKLLKNEEELRKSLELMGIKYDFPGFHSFIN